MINKEKLISALENKVEHGIYHIDVQNLINELKNGYYEARCVDTHAVDEYYKE